eukprot:scaffold7340_cov266-Pinguiococcus_pyrenoidosus.AAC.72
MSKTDTRSALDDLRDCRSPLHSRRCKKESSGEMTQKLHERSVQRDALRILQHHEMTSNDRQNPDAPDRIGQSGIKGCVQSEEVADDGSLAGVLCVKPQ